MQITLIPQRRDDDLILSRRGDALLINGTAYDLTPLPEGATLPRQAVACEWLASDIVRVDGQIVLALLSPYGTDRAADPPTVSTITPEPDDTTGSPGGIDWAAMITPAQSDAAALAAWRAGCVISKLDLLLALMAAGILSPASAAGTSIPAELAGPLQAVPQALRDEITVRWAHVTGIPRLSPVILAVQGALGWSDAQVDALFGWG